MASKRGVIDAARRGPQRSEDRSVTDADREVAAAVQNRWLSQRVSDHGTVQWTHEDYIAQAIARARVEEREACALECEAVCPPAGLYTPGELSAYEAAVQDCAAAIRARGERDGGTRFARVRVCARHADRAALVLGHEQERARGKLCL